MAAHLEDEHEALLQFLYIAPIGIVQALSCGEIVMVNPLCAQLLLPLAPGGDLSNLFTALEGVAPELRRLTQEFTAPYGKICDALQLLVPPRPGGDAAALQVLSLTLLKLDGNRLMAVLGDVTQAVLRERALHRSRAWIDNIFTALPDYAFVALDGEGRVEHWNPSIGRVTGFGPEAVVGRSFALFNAPDAASDTLADGDAGARLRQADGVGWSLAEGWQQRADGSRFWGSCLIAPLQAPASDAAPPVLPEPRAYSLILRQGSSPPEVPTPVADHGVGADAQADHRPATSTAAPLAALR